jgi:hypothetical protein
MRNLLIAIALAAAVLGGYYYYDNQRDVRTGESILDAAADAVDAAEDAAMDAVDAAMDAVEAVADPLPSSERSDDFVPANEE